MNKNPLFLPEGSVRALAFIFIIGTICYLSIVSKNIPELLADIALITISFYFGTKAKKNENDFKRYESQEKDAKDFDNYLKEKEETNAEPR